MMRRILAAVVTLTLSACSGASVVTSPLPPTTPPTITPTPAPPTFWIQPGVPQTLVERITPVLTTQAGLTQADAPEVVGLRVVINPGPDAALTAQWLYALAAPFPTVPDDVAWSAFQTYYARGDPSGLAGFPTPPELLLTPSSVNLLAAITGAPPSPGHAVFEAEPASSDLLTTAWGLPSALTIIPFESLEPRWKVLSIDGMSVLDENLDLSAYPLTITIGAVATDDAGAQAAALLQSSGAWQATNRDPARMTTLVMTGVTAMARATAWYMDARGVNFPAENIMPFFADADILHTSNEVAFANSCPVPELVGEAVFCSAPRNLELLQTISLDVVELTGNHINDWGTEALSYTLDLYAQNGITYYGGGRDLTDAQTPRIVTAPDGTRFAFLGCNSAGPYRAWATDFTPGAAPCGDWIAFRQQIADLRAGGQADIIVVTLQYDEIPRYAPSDQQRADFEALAAAGATIVSGSQAHQPQGFSFANGAFVHFGVGNLFFDQMDYVENRQMFADKYIFYEGRHISTVLFTGMMEHYSQPRPMTPEERAAFLALIFEASGW